MEQFIGRPVIWSAQRGEVVGQSEKRGKAFLTVRLASGREILIAAKGADFADVPRFAPAATFAELAADYRNDNINRRRMMGI